MRKKLIEKKKEDSEVKKEEKENPKEKEKLKEESNKETKQNKIIHFKLHKNMNLRQVFNKNKLLELSENNKIIAITVSEPKKEQVRGFFTKTLY